LNLSGSYRFRFSLKKNKLGIWIDYFDKDQNKQLLTSLIGELEPLNQASLNRVFWVHPFVTFKAILLIHWQALKLICKKIAYIKKPRQNEQKLSATLNLQKQVKYVKTSNH
jgi:DUF1365 family protein